MFRSLSLLAAAELTASARRLLRALPWLVAGAVFGLIALVLALQAAHAWLVLWMTSMEAWLVLAGAMAFVAAICAGVGLVIRSRRARTSPLVASALVAAPAAVRVVASRKVLAPALVAVVAVIGIATGRSLVK